MDNQRQPYFVDAHCHLTDSRVADLARDWIKRAVAQNVQQMMIGGLDPADWDRQKILQKEFPQNLKISFGLHPWWVEKLSRPEIDQALAILKQNANDAHAIGETGLDFFHKRDTNLFKLQEEIFCKHLEIAKTANKPVVLHLVKSHARALELVKASKSSHLKFLLHSFSGSTEIAQEWLKLDSLLSFNGNLLRSGPSPRAIQVLVQTNLNKIVFETDSPDQAWRKDQTHEPCYIREIYEKAAGELKISVLDLMQNVAENFSHFS